MSGSRPLAPALVLLLGACDGADPDPVDTSEGERIVREPVEDGNTFRRSRDSASRRTTSHVASARAVAPRTPSTTASPVA